MYQKINKINLLSLYEMLYICIVKQLKQTIMTKRIEFDVMFRTKFGIAIDKRKCHLGETPEQTFKNALNSLPKWINKTKESIDFEQDGSHFHISFETLREMKFEFDLSVEITELCE